MPRAPETYLPEGCLDDLITEATISEELSQTLFLHQSTEKEQQFINVIAQCAKKVFTTAVLTKIGGDLIYKVINEFGITDDKLPIDSNNPFLGSLHVWDALQFSKHQWMFLVPVFVEDKLVYHLETQHILPFIEVEDQQRRALLESFPRLRFIRHTRSVLLSWWVNIMV